jgi:hypothetical protein
MTVGVDGLRGASVVTLILLASGFEAQAVAVPKQKAFRSPPLSVTLSPTDKYTILLAILVIIPKDALTALVFTQEHVVFEALLNVNNKLQGQELATMPASLVSESKVISTAWPLSEKRLDMIIGAGTGEEDDNI